MSTTFGKLLVFSGLLLVCSACSDDLEHGVEAYRRGDYSVAIRELRPLAENGDATAQNYLGFMYDNGEGVPLDYSKAAEWYRKAAEQGNEVAQHNLGLLYGNGLGVQQDWVQALKWINLAVIVSKGKHTQAAKDGNFAANRMTPEQVKEAERLADEWLARHHQLLNNH